VTGFKHLRFILWRTEGRNTTTSKISHRISENLTSYPDGGCVGFQTERNIAACCVRKLRWGFPAAMPRRTSHASDTGFSLRHLPAADTVADRQFSARGDFRSQPAAKKTLPAWVVALLWVLASSSLRIFFFQNFGDKWQSHFTEVRSCFVRFATALLIMCVPVFVSVDFPGHRVHRQRRFKPIVKQRCIVTTQLRCTFAVRYNLVCRPIYTQTVEAASKL